MPAHIRTIRPLGLLREAVTRAATWADTGCFSDAHSRIAGVITDEIRVLPEEPFGLPLPGDPRVARVAHAILGDPADTRGIAHWASLASVSERTLSRRFVEEAGFSLTSWRQRARLLRSLELLAHGEPVTSIALSLGYASPSSFIALFRREFGVPPTAWRARMSSIASSAA